MMKTGIGIHFRQTLYFQLFFWVALFLFGIARSYGEYSDGILKELVIYNFCHWIFQIMGANFIYYILISHFFDRKKYVEFSIALMVSLYAISVINRIFIVYMAEPFFINETKDSLMSIFTDIRYLLLHYTFPIISGAFIFISIMFFIRYKDEKENTMKLQKEKAELELKSLKSQLNPHFLFNTLNNIYSLSITHSEKTSQSISQLSDILDYILYKGQKKWVPIADELTIIDHYIALESLRYPDKRLKITKHVNIKSSSSVPPLLYLTLVENAFKHGAGKSSEPTEIKITAETNNKQSIFKIENTFESNDNNEKGIGLQNVRKQLQYHYQEHFFFNISQENNIFNVEIITPAHYD
ncbi:GHKL domain-containing protein [Chryseobacterium joostei]|uniref:GHKL domain-containing protein n=1 Tax=Chryseobacterium joostei TaxID=112234 RepID=A0A1N7JBP2_9FLAO|nr:histidine kinase [Chryseobacterium joostei]AZA99399.1 GHKL domain-containing protein [Chryseobacterium joostei]SIS30730.1 GHKL domain-containing protein [Chryseobacterium joostei]SIS46748.1 GHKL domain-containing protein [Chryseobacterium joostei]